MSFRVKLRLKSLKGIFPTPALPAPPIPDGCSKCGLRFADFLGRPISLGYVCGRAGCPCGLGGSFSVSAVKGNTFAWNGGIQ